MNYFGNPGIMKSKLHSEKDEVNFILSKSHISSDMDHNESRFGY